MSAGSRERKFEKKFPPFRTSVARHGRHMRRKKFLKVVLDSRGQFLSRHIQTSTLENESDFRRLISDRCVMILDIVFYSCATLPPKIFSNLTPPKTNSTTKPYCSYYERVVPATHDI